MKNLNFCLLILAFGLFGCSTLKKPFYYQIEDSEGTKAYMLGTVHIGVPINDLPGEITEQIQKSNPIFVEYDMRSNESLQAEIFAPLLLEDIKKTSHFKKAEQIKKDGPKNKYDEAVIKSYDTLFALTTNPNSTSTGANIIIPKASFSKGETLKSKFTKDEWSQVVSNLKSIFGDEATIETLHIETVFGFLTSKQKSNIMVTRAKAKRYDPQWSMDLNLAIQAEKNKQTLRLLDTTASFSPECMAELYLMMIKESLRKNGQMLLADYDNLVDTYKSGDTENIYQLTAGSLSQKNFQCLLVNRNNIWLPQIEAQMKESKDNSTSPFFAFGVGHLGGPQGIIKLLQDKGYKVQRVEF